MATNPLIQFLSDLKVYANGTNTPDNFKADTEALLTSLSTNGPQNLPQTFVTDLVDYQTNGNKGTGLLAQLMTAEGSAQIPLAMAILAEYAGNTDTIIQQILSSLYALIKANGHSIANGTLFNNFFALAYLSNTNFNTAFQEDLANFAANHYSTSSLIAQLSNASRSETVPLAIAILAEYAGNTDTIIQQMLSSLNQIANGNAQLDSTLLNNFFALAYLSNTNFNTAFQEDLANFLANHQSTTSLIAQLSNASKEQQPTLAKQILAEYKG